MLAEDHGFCSALVCDADVCNLMCVPVIYPFVMQCNCDLDIFDNKRCLSTMGRNYKGAAHCSFNLVPVLIYEV